MPIIDIRPCTVAQVRSAPNIEALMIEYAQESHNAELPNPNVQWTQYEHMEALGILTAFGAYENDDLVGFISVLTNSVPHHGVTLAITESFFVAKAHRAGSAGMRLLKAAEDRAREVNAGCLMVTAPHGGALEKVMPRVGYRHCNSVFVRALS